MDGFLGSYLAITVFLILTGCGLPLPEEFFIVGAGVLAASGQLEPFLAVACCLVGALVGDCLMYWIGYHFGRGVLCKHRWWARYVTPEREARIEEEFHRHGLKVFFVARFLVGLRTPVYLTAGILRLSFKKFVLIDLICATVVVGSFFALAYFFGQVIAIWIRRGEWGLTIGVIIALVCVAFYLWRRHVRKKKSTAPPAKRLEDILLPTAGGQSPAETDATSPCAKAVVQRSDGSNGNNGKSPEAAKKRSESSRPLPSAPADH